MIWIVLIVVEFTTVWWKAAIQTREASQIDVQLKRRVTIPNLVKVR